MGVRRLAFTLILIAVLPFHSARAADTLELGINELAQAIVQSARETNARTIAVAPFPHTDDTCSELSNYIVDELILSLFLIPNAGLQIVERGQLRTILAELGLALTGAIDTNTAQQIGRIHGVNSLVVGSLTVVGDRLRIIARVIGTETGLVHSAAATTIPITETVAALMGNPAAAGCGLVAGTAAPPAPLVAGVPTAPRQPLVAPADPPAGVPPVEPGQANIFAKAPYELNWDLGAVFGQVALTAGFTPDPYSVNLVAGGPVDVDDFDLPSGCQGFVTAAPHYRLQYTATSYRLYISVVSDADLTLVIADPEGNWICDDDDGEDLNPLITFTGPLSGQYDIWIGTYYEGAGQPATLKISEVAPLN